MSRIPYAKQPINTKLVTKEQSEKIDTLPFAELRRMVLTEIIPALTMEIENSRISATLAKTSVSSYDVFENMFKGPLDNWRIPDETLEAARQKYLPLIELAMEDKTKTPYQRVGEIKDLFIEFRKEMPKRIHSLISKRGIPYGTRHEILRESMDCLLEGLSMRELPMHDQAYFPNGNPWSSTLAKILEKTPAHSKYEHLPSPLSFLFRIGRGVREYDRKNVKGEILSSLNSIEHLVISPRFGRLNEPRVNPWLWHASENADDSHTVRPTAFTILHENFCPGDTGRHKAKDLLEIIEGDSLKTMSKKSSLTHLQYHLLTADSTTINRTYIREVLNSWGGWDFAQEFSFESNPEQGANREKITNDFEREINTLGIEHIKANPWCIIDMPANIPPAWLKTALERQPLLILLENFTSLHTSWKEKIESIQPGSLDHIKNLLTSICYAFGQDIKEENTRIHFRNEVIRYFKDGGLTINDVSIDLDGLDGLLIGTSP